MKINLDLNGLDAYMDKILHDWNAPGIGIGIVKDDELVFAKGYGYRDYGEKLPFTPKTQFQIASNTKLFTAIAAGILVEEGKLEWDKPIRDYVPEIRFYNDYLNTNVTLRDMLAHRTGITRHDMIWFKSEFTRKEIFERIKYLEPREPIRQSCIYNNLMYAAVGYAIELLTGKTWEDFVGEKILAPLDMWSTHYSVPDMLQVEDHAVPFTEKRDSDEIYQIPHYSDQAGVAPCGAIVSTLEDMSHWLAALMNNGFYNDKAILSPKVLKATLEPSIALSNVDGEARGFWELINPNYGMGRSSVSYRGHLMTSHGGGLPGSYSQVSFLPQSRVGVIAFVIGNHCSILSNIIGYNIFEQMLGMSETPWSERWLLIMKKAKENATEARSKAGLTRVEETRPSHALKEYEGEYEHPAYGLLKISLIEKELHFEFHKIKLPLAHYHYDRFDTPDDEQDGKWSVNFLTDPQGEIDKAVMSLDQAEVTFTRRPIIISEELRDKILGVYESPTGFPVEVIEKEDGAISLSMAGSPDEELVPYKGLKLRSALHSDKTFEFVFEGESISSLKIIVPAGEFVFLRR